MNNEISDQEIVELTNRLKREFARITFDQPLAINGSRSNLKKGMFSVTSVAAAALAFALFVTSTPSPTWASEPESLTTSQITSIENSCSSKIGDAGLSLFKGDQLPPAIATDFRGGFGFTMFKDGESGLQITCSFEKVDDEFKVLGVMISSDEATRAQLSESSSDQVMIMKRVRNVQDGRVVEDSNIITSLIQKAAPSELWQGEDIALVAGLLSDGAATIELRSEKYPTWKPTISGKEWAMIIPTKIAGNLVELSKTGEVISEKSFSLNN
jgi:hypothetical protein